MSKSLYSKFNIFEYHKDKIDILNQYVRENKIPNIIFHGEHGSGKKMILKKFINEIYKDISIIEKKEYIMNVNCAHSKGIKFIRNELKFFAKTHMNENKNNFIKSIILINAEYLTMDAQSALRRCIELFSKNTRFFIVIENKEKLLKPILSRFCDFYFTRPIIGNKEMSLHNMKQLYQPSVVYNNKNKNMKNILQKLQLFSESINNKSSLNNKNNDLYMKFNIFDFIEGIYEKGIYASEIVDLIIQNEKNQSNLSNMNSIDDLEKVKFIYKFKCYYDKIKSQYCSEKLLLFHILNYYIMRNDYILENIDTL
jgi:DNA polymerase III delta prime subunit